MRVLTAVLTIALMSMSCGGVETAADSTIGAPTSSVVDTTTTTAPVEPEPVTTTSEPTEVGSEPDATSGDTGSSVGSDPTADTETAAKLREAIGEVTRLADGYEAELEALSTTVEEALGDGPTITPSIGDACCNQHLDELTRLQGRMELFARDASALYDQLGPDGVASLPPDVLVTLESIAELVAGLEGGTTGFPGVGDGGSATFDEFRAAVDGEIDTVTIIRKVGTDICCL